VLLLVTGTSIQLTRVSNLADPAAQASKGPGAGDIVKVLALFLQYVSIIGSLPVPWPNSLLAFISASEWVLPSGSGRTFSWAATPLECVLKGLRTPSAVAKQLINLFTPAIVVAVELSVFMGFYFCCSRQKKRVLQLPVVLLVSAFFTFPIFVRAVFSFFACFGVQDATLQHSLWWVQDMAQACYLGYHRAWAFSLAIPCMIICCCAPLALFVGLWRNSGKMAATGFRASYGHLYRLYGTHAYGYEAVVLVQTIALVAIAVFASQIGSYTAVLLAGLHIVVSLQLLHFVRPYTQRSLHVIHVASLLCLLADVFVALLMFADFAETVTRSVAVTRTVVAAFALAANVCLVVVCCVLITRCFLRGPGAQRSSGGIARWATKLMRSS
jgi:hypothetical protein